MGVKGAKPLKKTISSTSRASAPGRRTPVGRAAGGEQDDAGRTDGEARSRRWRFVCERCADN